MFSKSSVNKKFFFLVLLKYREIRTVKTVTVNKKLYFFIKSLKKQEKEADTTFVYYVTGEIWLEN